MKYLFKQAAGFDGRSYPQGVHEVHEDAVSHHFFKRMVDAGLIEEHREKVLVHPDPKPDAGAPRAEDAKPEDPPKKARKR